MKITLWLGAILLIIVALGWIGLQIRPTPFAPVDLPAQATQTVPLPDDLPDPVDRFYRQMYGDEVPVVETAVLSGRASMRIAGITFPARFRFTHRVGQDYRHYIEATLFGLPLMKVNEHYLDGVSRLALPVGVTEDEPNVNQGANLALWGEAIWFPTLFVTDERVRWEAVDENTAVLHVPYGTDEETFVVRFDPETGRPLLLEAMRYKGAEAVTKTLWLNEVQDWDQINGIPIAKIGAVTWFDEGSPWAVFHVEEVIYNAELADYIRAEGQ